MNDRLIKALEDLGFNEPELIVVHEGDPPTFGLTVPSDYVMDSWQKLRSAAEVLQRWPVILGPMNRVAIDVDHPDPDATLGELRGVDIEAWFADRKAEYEQYLKEWEQEDGNTTWPACPVFTEVQPRIPVTCRLEGLEERSPKGSPATVAP